MTCDQDEFCAFDDRCQLQAAHRLIAALLCIEEVRFFAYGKPPQFNKGEKMSDILKQQRDECMAQLERLQCLCHENCNFLEKMTDIHSAAIRGVLSNLKVNADPAAQMKPAAWLSSGSHSVLSYWQEGLNCSLEYQRQTHDVGLKLFLGIDAAGEFPPDLETGLRLADHFMHPVFGDMAIGADGADTRSNQPPCNCSPAT